MKKVTKISLIAAACLVLAGLLLVLFSVTFLHAQVQEIWNSGMLNVSFVGVGPRSGYQELDGAYETDNSYFVSTQDIQNIDLKWISGAVTVTVTDDGDAAFFETSGDTITEKTALRYGVKGTTLYIQYCAKNAPGNLPMKDLELRLPRALMERLGDFSFDGSSATLTVSGLSAEHFSFFSASGNLNAEGMTVGSANLDSTSGSISFSGAFCRANADSVSGGIRIESLGAAESVSAGTTSGSIAVSGDCGEVTVSTVSGKISSFGRVSAARLSIDSVSGAANLSGAFEAVEADTTSGNVEISSDLCPREINVDTTSGDVKLFLPRSSDFELDYDTVSGKLQCAFEVSMENGRFICGSGAARFSVDTTSGDLELGMI